MKNKILASCFLASALLAFSGCETYEDLFPAEYHQVLTIKDAGTIPVTLYTTGEDGKYTFTVMKGGSEPSSSATATVVSLSDAEFTDYCNTWNLHYTLLPAEYYSLAGNELNFEGDGVRYKFVDAIFKTDQIKALMEQNSGVSYALPLLLSSPTASVTDSLIILTPDVVTPEISFTTSGYNQLAVFTAEDTAPKSISLPIALPIENQWDFTVEVSVDEEAFNTFNAANGNRYLLLDASCYTLSNNGQVTFTSASPDASLGITLNCPTAYGEYILPLTITSCSMEGFVIGASRTIYVGVNHSLSKIDLEVSQLSANSIEGSADGTGLAGLLDGRASGKHFHSSWTAPIGDPIYGNYIQVDLKQPIQYVSFDYYTRFENGNSAPTMIEIFVSEDGQAWRSLDVITSDLPTGGDALYASRIYDAGSQFSYFRFCVLTSRSGDCRVGSFFNLGEFILYGN